MRTILLVSLAITALVAFLAVKLTTGVGLNRGEYITYSVGKGGETQVGELATWKYRDGLTTCYVFVARSGREQAQVLFPTASCSILYP